MKTIASLLFLLCLITPTSHADQWVYIVSPGDNLWDLSAKHLDKVTRFEQVRKLNNIQHPTRMRPGTKVRIPMKWIRSNAVSATIMTVEGDVELVSPSNRTTVDSPRLIKPGQAIKLGDQIHTYAGSSATVKFADQTVLTIHEQSRVKFDHLSAHGDTGMVDSRMRVLKGRAETKVQPAKGPGSRFEIHTPSAVSAVRGTEYRASVSDDGTISSIEVLEGKVAVEGEKKQRLISAGYGTQIATGKAPAAARKLLPAPNIESPPHPIRQINWRLSWQPLEGASSYRVEIARDKAFRSIIWQQQTRHAKSAIPDLPDGSYFARVRGIDNRELQGQGLEGHNQTVQILLDARPQPPLALSPTENEVFRGKIPALKWTASADAVRYRIEIATDPQFNRPLVNKAGVKGTSFDLPSLFNQTENSEIGQYFWRLTSIANDGEEGPTGITRAFEIKPIPAKVDANLAASDDGQLIASWPTTAEQQRYHVQVSEDKNFSKLLVDEVIDQPKLLLETPAKHARHLRVKSIESDGYEGPWGATQTFYAPRDNSYWIVIIGGLFGLILI